MLFDLCTSGQCCTLSLLSSWFFGPSFMLMAGGDGRVNVALVSFFASTVMEGR